MPSKKTLGVQPLSVAAAAPRRISTTPVETNRASKRVDLGLRSSRRSRPPSTKTVGVSQGPAKSKRGEPFDVEVFLHSTGITKKIVNYRRGDAIFKQGDPCSNVLYIHTGLVKISVVSKRGRQAVVAMLGPGDFFGEGGLAGQPVRMASATAVTASTILLVDQSAMASLLHQQHAMSDRLIAHLLAKTIRSEEELVDQLFSSSEKRLARKLLVLARYGEPAESGRTVPAISQETLAEIVGTTRSRVNVFMKKFQRLGFIDYGIDSGTGLRVHDSLLTVVLYD